jgi:hypothetical protein
MFFLVLSLERGVWLMHCKMLYGGFLFSFHPQLLSTTSVLLRSDLCGIYLFPHLFDTCYRYRPLLDGPCLPQWVHAFLNISFTWHLATSLYDHRP